MKLPFVSRKVFESLLERYEAEKGKTIVYVPVDTATRQRLKTLQIVDEKYAYHDGRIGWVERQEFDNYSDYIQFKKSDQRNES